MTEGKTIAWHNGQSFRFNEVVHVWEGTTPGVRPEKTELIKAWFKGIDTQKDKFICRPVVGHSGGPFPRFEKGAVYKQKVFGLGVFEERGRRIRWERIKPETQERIMEKASATMHSKLKKAQKDQAQVRRKLTEHDGLAHERQVIAMERMAAKHEREVQIALDKDRVERDGDLRLQTRKARQAEVELLKVQGGHSEISEQLDLLLKDNNALVKTIARERRQHSVDTQTWESKCGNLEASLSLRRRQEESKKRQLKAAMDKADNMSDWLKTKMKALKTEEGQLRWKRHKEARQLDVEKAALNARKYEVSLAAKTIDRKKLALSKERKDMDGKHVALGRTSAKLTAEKKTLLRRNAKIVAFRRVWNQRRKQANKNLKQQRVELTRLETELSKVKTMRVVTNIRHADRKKGLSLEFEAFVRSVLACGCSARQARDTILLTAGFLLPAALAVPLCEEVPTARWFVNQREALGLEATVYAFMAVGSCDEVVQWGFDETTLDGTACFNQWCLVRAAHTSSFDDAEFMVVVSAPGTAHSIVTIECAGILPCSTAEETITHVEKTWERGQTLLEMVRAELGSDICDELVPLVNGGARLHKIFGLMHDTCSTANRVAALMAELRDTKSRAFHGDAAWDAADSCQKIVHDFLCGNHSRNLLVDRANGFYDAYLEAELGEAIRAACVATGGRVRLECSGVSFLRSICRLTHRGHAQYVKGDGDAFGDFLEANYPGLNNNCLSRADYSNRQDWCLEAAYEIFPLLQPLLDYEVKSLLDDPNVLRDSILIQLETLHFEAYCHVCALLWRVVFMELRGLTNSKGLEIDPLTLNRVYEDLYDVGLLMQTPQCLALFKPNFRPWPHLYQNKRRSATFYTHLERNLEADMTRLRAFTVREDADQYEAMLITVVGLFGKGIISSLQYTMKDYLKQTGGHLRTEQREEWEINKCKAMLCHNNHAERPFAVLRQYKHLYPSLSLTNLSKLSQSLVNGTHRPAGKGVMAGIALTADPRLRSCIGQLCSVRRKKVGQITSFMRGEWQRDRLEATIVRKRKAAQRYADNVRKKAKHAAKRDHAETILSMSLVTSIPDLELQLRARVNSSAARVSFLKDQFHARVSGANPRAYPGIGPKYRSKFGKLKLTPSDTKENKEEYLVALVKSMIKEDEDVPGTNNNVPNLTQHFVRVLPSLAEGFTNPVSSNLKAEFAKHIADSTAPQDDPVYIDLHGKYIGKIIYDFETRSSSKLFRVSAIQFVRSYTTTRYSCWEATCEPVIRDPLTGHFVVPHNLKVPDSNVTITRALQGYCLAEYPNGIDADPTYFPWVQQYSDHFRTVIQPKYQSLLLASPAKMPSPTSLKDLPSSTRTPKRRTRPQTRTRRNVAEEAVATD